MQPLNAITSYALAWIKPSWRKYHYELRDGDNVVATLDIKGMMNQATGATSAGAYLFKRAGFWKQRILVLDSPGGNLLATYTTHWTGTRGELTFTSGARFQRSQRGFWQHESLWSDGNGQLLFRHTANWKNQTLVTLDPAASSRAETGILLLLAQFVTTVAASEAATVAATTAATS